MFDSLGWTFTKSFDTFKSSIKFSFFCIENETGLKNKAVFRARVCSYF